MKFSKVITGVATFVLLACVAKAAETNRFVFPWSNSDNPASPDPILSLDPSGATARATLVGSDDYYFGNAFNDAAHYGTPTGIWDVYGSVNITLDRTSVTPVDFIIQITQFYNPSGFLPGTVSLSIPGSTYVGRTVDIPKTGSMFGAWVTDTYQWSQATLFPTFFNLTISPGTGNGELLLDKVTLETHGTLGVPEPSCSLLALVGLMTLGIRSFRRRKS